MLDLRRLQLLRDLEVHGSIAGVSRALGISSSAISQQLTKLESEAGTPLLERVGRNLELTPAGQLLARQATRIEHILEEAEAELAARRSHVQGVVRFASFSSFALRFLPDLIRRMGRTHPEVVVEFAHVEPTEAIEAVSGRRADIAVTDEYPGIPRETDARMVREFLFRDGLAAFVPRSVDSFDELAELSWMLEPAGTDARVWAERLCRGAGFEPQVHFESPDMRLHFDVAAQGLAAVFLPDLVSSRDRAALAGAEFAWPADSKRLLYRDVSAVVRRGAETRPAVAAFMRHLRELVAELDSLP